MTGSEGDWLDETTAVAMLPSNHSRLMVGTWKSQTSHTSDNRGAGSWVGNSAIT